MNVATDSAPAGSSGHSLNGGSAQRTSPGITVEVGDKAQAGRPTLAARNKSESSIETPTSQGSEGYSCRSPTASVMIVSAVAVVLVLGIGALISFVQFEDEHDSAVAAMQAEFHPLTAVSMQRFEDGLEHARDIVEMTAKGLEVQKHLSNESFYHVQDAFSRAVTSAPTAALLRIVPHAERAWYEDQFGVINSHNGVTFVPAPNASRYVPIQYYQTTPALINLDFEAIGAKFIFDYAEQHHTHVTLTQRIIASNTVGFTTYKPLYDLDGQAWGYYATMMAAHDLVLSSLWLAFDSPYVTLDVVDLTPLNASYPSIGNEVIAVERTMKAANGDIIEAPADFEAQGQANGICADRIVMFLGLKLQLKACGTQQYVDSKVDADGIRGRLIANLLITLGIAVVAGLLSILLQARIKNRLKVLEAARAAAEQVMSYVCHELRNPVHVVAATVDLLFLDHSHTMSESAKQELAAIKDSAVHMTYLVNDVLNMQKLAQGVMVMDENPTQVVAMMKEIGNMYKRLVGPNVTFSVNVGGNVPDTVVLDKLRVRQIIGNGMTNAAKYTRKGHILLACSLEQREEGAGHWLHLSVRNTGGGLHGLTEEQLFTPFQSGSGHGDVKSSWGNSVQGTGLGLPIAKQLVECMKGEIHLFDEMLETVFSVKLPLKLPEGQVLADVAPAHMQSVLGQRAVSAEEVAEDAGEGIGAAMQAAAEAGGADESKSSEGSSRLVVSKAAGQGSHSSSSASAADVNVTMSKTSTEEDEVKMEAVNLNTVPGRKTGPLKELHVLVVDDEPFNRRVLSRYLKHLGATCTSIIDGIHVNEVLEKAEPPVNMLLMDIIMERSNGVQVCCSLRERGVQIPIVATTASVLSSKEIRQYKRDGFTGILPKPFTKDMLGTLLKKIMATGNGWTE